MSNAVLGVTVLQFIALLGAAPEQAATYRGVWEPCIPRPATRPSASAPSAAPTVFGPVATYDATSARTYFVFIGQPAEQGPGPAVLVGFYDHRAGTFSRPAVVTDLPGPGCGAVSLVVDREGVIRVLVTPADGRARFWASEQPHTLGPFKAAPELPFDSAQAWHLDRAGLVCLHGLPGKRGLWVSISKDGVNWDEPALIAEWADARTAVVGRAGGRLGLAFAALTSKGGSDIPTSLYSLQTEDGKAWSAVPRQPMQLPVQESGNPARIYDYAATPFAVYLKDLVLDAQGNPTVLYMTRGTTVPAGRPRPCYWNTARWSTRGWEINQFATSDHPGDTARLYVEQGNIWRFIGTTGPGPRTGQAGGDLTVWLSADFGRSWSRSPLASLPGANLLGVNRPVYADPGMYALWQRGDCAALGSARLYFSTREGEAFTFPDSVVGEIGRPIPFKRQAASAPATSTGAAD